LRGQTPRIGASRCDNGGSRWSARRVDGCDGSTGGNGAIRGRPVVHGSRNPIGARAAARDGYAAPRHHHRGICRAVHRWRVLRDGFYSIAGGATRFAVVPRLRVRDMRGDQVAPRRGVAGIDTRSRIFARDRAAIPRPVVTQGVLRVEVVGHDGRHDRLAYHHFCGLERTACTLTYRG
jgi:hypothetical protein